MFLIRVAAAALAYLSNVLFARWMGSYEFGIFVYVWTWVLLIGQALAVVADVTSSDQTQAFVAKTVERFGRLDVMMCNAGFGIYGAIASGTAVAPATIGRRGVVLPIQPLVGNDGAGRIPWVCVNSR